jgi:hypothetical protein
MHRTLSTIGVLVSAGYVIGVVWLFGWEFAQIKSMKPNEIGDFLTGVFGPLAILWLILGYFQQGIELRQNTQALKLQAEELKNSAAEQRELVSTTRAQLKAERDHLALRREEFERTVLPSFVFTGLGSVTKAEGATYQIHVRNLGAITGNVRFVPMPPFARLSPVDIPVFMSGQEHILEFQFEDGHPRTSDRLRITFRDSAGRLGNAEFAFVLNDSGNFCDVARYES